ncbi:MAG: hypothetical protein ACO3NZ_14905 [Pirellulales bacterium]|jgi:hypothetical protein
MLPAPEPTAPLPSPRLPATPNDRGLLSLRWHPTLWGLAGALSLLLAAHLITPPWAVGQRQPSPDGLAPTADSMWLWMSQREGDPNQLLLAIDRETRHAAVYHVDLTSGTLTLRSTRNLSWDLLVDDFNGREPSPTALRNMLETGDTPR